MSFLHRQVNGVRRETGALVPSLKTDLHWFIGSVSEVDEAARFRKGLITQSVMFGSGGKCEPNHPEFGPKSKGSRLHQLSSVLTTSDVFNFHCLLAKAASIAVCVCPCQRKEFLHFHFHMQGVLMLWVTFKIIGEAVTALVYCRWRGAREMKWAYFDQGVQRLGRRPAICFTHHFNLQCVWDEEQGLALRSPDPCVEWRERWKHDRIFKRSSRSKSVTVNYVCGDVSKVGVPACWGLKCLEQYFST